MLKSVRVIKVSRRLEAIHLVNSAVDWLTFENRKLLRDRTQDCKEPAWDLRMMNLSVRQATRPMADL